MKRRFREERIIAILGTAEGAPSKAEIRRKHGIAGATFHRWRGRYRGRIACQLRTLVRPKQENARLKKPVAEPALAH